MMMNAHISRLLLATGLALSGIFSGHAQEKLFHSGEAVCFIGNSITFNGGFHHNITLYYATRFPGEKVYMYNCGIGGNFDANVIARMDRDILLHQPACSVIMLGMNDVRRELYMKENAGKPGNEEKRQEALNVYRKDYETIIQTLLRNNSRIILQTPTIYDQTAAIASELLNGRNDALGLCAGYVKGFGKKYHVPVVDYQTPMLAINGQMQARDPKATIIGADRVHTGLINRFRICTK